MSELIIETDEPTTQMVNDGQFADLTVTQEILEDLKIEFSNETDRLNFEKYCQYMLFKNNEDDERPVADEDIKDWFKPLYREVEGVYTTALQIASETQTEVSKC
jgi:hypothetical protein